MKSIYIETYTLILVLNVSKCIFKDVFVKLFFLDYKSVNYKSVNMCKKVRKAIHIIDTQYFFF